MTARIGLLTPVVVQHPRTAAAWERDVLAGPDVGGTLLAIARAADDLGYHHLTCSEHVAVPAPIAAERGGTYFDPVATLSFLASATRRVRLATNVVVIGYHHPLALAKTYGTLDLLSGGRVILGVGVGSLEEEFDLLGAEFAGRGAVADEAIAALRAAWGRAVPHHEGPGSRSPTSSSNRTRRAPRCRCGSVGAPAARCAVPWRTAPGGRRSASGRRS